MTKPSPTSANFTRRAALAALVGLCGYGGYRWWERRRSNQHWLAEYEVQQAQERELEKIVSIQLGQTTLRKWLDEFTRQSGVAVEIVPDADGRPVENLYLEICDDTHIGVDLPRLTAAETLDCLSDLYLARWRLRSDGIIVVNDQKDEEPLLADVYPLPAVDVLSAEDVIDQIEFHFEINWLGGWPTSSMEHTAGALTIVNTRRRHERIRQFLDRLAVACVRARSAPVGLTLSLDAWEPTYLDGDDRHWQELQQALDRPIHLQAKDQPWAEFVADLMREARFPLVVHPGLVAVLDVATWRVTCRLDGVPLRDVLRKARPFDPLEFEALAGGRVLVITTREGRDGPFPLVLLAYPVGDLACGAHPRATKQLVDDLGDLTRSMVEPDSWTDVGGDGDAQLIGAGRLLVVSQSLERHEHVRGLLRALREVRSGVKRNVACLPGPRWPVHSSEVTARLAVPITYEYCGVRRQKVLEDAFARGGVALPAFYNGLLHAQGPLWCYLPERPLRENLELLLTGCHYDRHYLDHVLLPTDAMEPYEEQDTVLTTEVFELRPWLARHGTELNAPRLLLVLDMDHWEDVGGPGSMQTFRDLLVVRCQVRLMARIRDLLGAVEQRLRPGNEGTWRGQTIVGEALNQPLELFSDTDEERVHAQKIAARNKELAAKLQKRVSLDVRERNIGEVLLELAREHELPVVVHTLPPPPEPPRRPDPNDPFGGRHIPTDLFVSHAAKDPSLVSLQVVDKPLLEVLGALIDQFDYPEKQGWDIKHGCLTLGPLQKPVANYAGIFLYTVDDLVVPRGPLLPRQLLRTLDQQLEGLDNSRPTSSYIEFQMANLMSLSVADLEPAARDIIEHALRDLRSGKLKPLPPKHGDSDFSEPYSPYEFRPFVTGPIPVVG